jgi:hypothetical protein
MAYKTQLPQQLEPEHDSVTAESSYSGDQAENQWTRTMVASQQKIHKVTTARRGTELSYGGNQS